jgi:hypothetical protein
LPRRSSPELPNAIHSHSLRKVRLLRHPYIDLP